MDEYDRLHEILRFTTEFNEKQFELKDEFEKNKAETGEKLHGIKEDLRKLGDKEKEDITSVRDEIKKVDGKFDKIWIISRVVGITIIVMLVLLRLIQSEVGFTKLFESILRLLIK